MSQVSDPKTMQDDAPARTAPKRSRLAQGRSRDTRQAIIKAALELWKERGYATGIDETTAEEIAARAGIAKATFYFHFARKDDLLLETSWLSAKVFYEDVLKTLLAEASTEAVLEQVTARLVRRVEKVPRLALQRMLQAQQGPRQRSDNDEHFGFQRGFTALVEHGQRRGEIPDVIPAGRIGLMFEALLMASFTEWAFNDDAALSVLLRERFAVLLAGARAVSPDAVPHIEPESNRQSAPTVHEAAV